MTQSGEHRPALSGKEEPLTVGRAAYPAWLRYLFAALMVAAATGVRTGLLSSLGTNSPFVTFYPAVVLAALFGGLGPGLLASFLSVFAASFWMEPAGLPIIRETNDWLLAGVFFINCTMISGICEMMRRAQERAAKAEERGRAAQALRKSEERVRYILKYNPNAIAVLDRDMKYLMVSDRFLSDYRLGEVDVLGKSHYEIFPEIPDRWREVHQRCLAGAIERSEEDGFVRQDGSVDYNRWEIRPWYDDQGKIGGIIMYTEVITERKRAEEALKKNRELLRAVIDGTPDAIFVKEPDGRYLLFNTAAEHFTGKRAHEVIGQDDTFLFPPDEARVLMEGDRAIMAAGKTMTREEYLTDAAGSRLTLQVTKGPLYDKHGKLIGLFGISRDVTDLKRAEEALSVRVEQLRQAVRVSDLGIFDHDQRTDTIYWSPKMREICGWNAKDPVDLATYLGRIHPEDREMTTAAIQRAHDPTGDGLYAVEHRIVRPDGSISWLSVRSQTYFGTEGDRRQPLRTIGVALDVTERKKCRNKNQAALATIRHIEPVQPGHRALRQRGRIVSARLPRRSVVRRHENGLDRFGGQGSPVGQAGRLLWRGRGILAGHPDFVKCR